MTESKIKDIDFLILYNWRSRGDILYQCQIAAPTREIAKRRFLSSVKFSQQGRSPRRSVVVRQIIGPGEPIYIPVSE